MLERHHARAFLSPVFYYPFPTTVVSRGDFLIFSKLSQAPKAWYHEVIFGAEKQAAPTAGVGERRLLKIRNSPPN